MIYIKYTCKRGTRVMEKEKLIELIDNMSEEDIKFLLAFISELQ